jgi:uncharacterized protein affecting Mg2+/Co2+ transport
MCVHLGIEITVSAVPVHLMRASVCANVYRVRMRLVDPQFVNGSCQLVSRHWLIHYADGSTEPVEGEAGKLLMIVNTYASKPV